MDLKIGQVLTLEVEKENQENIKRYRTRVQDADDRYLYIDIPVDVKSGQLYYYWPYELSLHAVYVDAGGVAYRFPTQVKGRRGGALPLIVLSRPDPETVEKTQRRSYVRVPIALPLAVTDQNQNPLGPFKTLDVSAGGLAFEAEHRFHFHIGDRYTFYMALPFRKGGVKQLAVRGEIVRLNHSSNPDTVHVSVRFLDLGDAEEAMLVRFAFERQIELKEKGFFPH